MNRLDRQRLKSVISDINAWANQATQILLRSDELMTEADQAFEALKARFISIKDGDEILWYLLPLADADRPLVTVMAQYVAMPRLARDAEQAARALSTGSVSQAVSDTKPLNSFRRFFAGRQRKQDATKAADFLFRFHDWASTSGFDTQLESKSAWQQTSVSSVYTAEILSPEIGFNDAFSGKAEMVDRASLLAAKRALTVINRTLTDKESFLSEVISAADAVREDEAVRVVSDMPVDRLREVTSDRLRINALTSVGIETVADVLNEGDGILYLPGVGETTGIRMIAAARTLWQSTLDQVPVRLDPEDRSPSATLLLRALRAWDTARGTSIGADDLATARILQPVIELFGPGTSHVVAVPGSRTPDDLHQAMSDLSDLASRLGLDAQDAVDPWTDFLSRPADYYAMLAELGLLAEDEDKTHGDLPEDVIEAVRDFRLDSDLLHASLRGYQSFGARFALVQRKVIIGDEMGLGKTIEALAVLAHLRSQGHTNFLVVCPAAVLTNWMREITAKSALPAHRLHGPRRSDALKVWRRSGGVGVTTYDTLGWLQGKVSAAGGPTCVIFDEAHYIKNPSAQRSQRSLSLIRRSDYALLLTGTPMENRIDEFRNLVEYLQPELVVSATQYAPHQFRKQVAPAYLRRNQEDVLTELPELVEVNEWIPLSGRDADHYRSAVADGNFMAMRRAAFQAGARSEKMQRLVSIVEEAEENSRRVLIFSQFLDVLDTVAAALPGKVFGPLTGSVAPAKRQQMIDEFSQADKGAALIAQITAGGVGLNIQSASVVVICEPQLKPTIEWQAIARSRRMGQLESVQVHRLLSENGVDRRVTELLAEKSALFADFARISETAESAPEAYDISDADLARQIVASERARLLGVSLP